MSSLASQITDQMAEMKVTEFLFAANPACDQTGPSGQMDADGLLTTSPTDLAALAF